MKREELETAILKYETPFYIYDLDILTQEMARFRKCLGEQIKICFAMKANPFVVKHMSELADRIEVCSMGEFKICKELGIAPEKLLISGVLKETKDLPEITGYCGTKSVYTAESFQQFQYLAEFSLNQTEEVHIYPRLTSGNQFGVNKEDICQMIRAKADYPMLHIDGIHYFSGTQKKNSKVIMKELNLLDEFFEQLEKEEGFQVEALEYGPGVGVSYFQGKEVPLFEEEGLQEIASLVQNMKWKGTVTLEMGRALSALCGYYVTQIKDAKTNEDINYCIVDGGCHQLNYDGQIRGMYVPKIQVFPEDNDGEEKEWTVCGSLCTFNDVLCSGFKAKDLSIGKFLAFERVGAYSSMEGMALFLSHELPGVVIYSEKESWQEARKKTDTYNFIIFK